MVKSVIPNFGGRAHPSPAKRGRSGHRGRMHELRWEPAGVDRGLGSLTTPFEDWCAARGVHPETLGAWECFEAGQQSAQESGRRDELAGT